MSYKLYTDRPEIFECDIQLKGASLKDAIVRLVLESNAVSLVFEGTISQRGRCKIPVKRLRGLLEAGESGNMQLEVIADGDVYFQPWKSNYVVETSRQVAVVVEGQTEAPQVQITEVKQSTPSVSAKPVLKSKQSKILEHAKNMTRLLITNGIDFQNIDRRRNKVREIVSKYVARNPMADKDKKVVIEHILKILQRVK